MNSAAERGPTALRSLPWRRALAWLAFMGPFFFASYGFANWMAAQRHVIASVHFAWERWIPFLPWTIIPYWSIDLLYAISFLAWRSREDVDRHGLRLLTAQLISVAAFLAFPLHFAFQRPPSDGLPGAMFDALAALDQPYNQAPALHISLLVILWVRFAPLLRGAAGWLGHLWLGAIGVSVLTTYQHHFIDVPTGALVGFLCLWLWPDGGPLSLRGWSITDDLRRRQLAAGYGLGALLLALIAIALGGAALWLLWGTVALALVSLAYLALGPEAFQKKDGRHSVAAAMLLAPYTLGAWVNSRLWTRGRHPADEVADGVSIGRMPTAGEARGLRCAALVDLCAELPAPLGDWYYFELPRLDLVVPSVADLRSAAQHITAARSHGEVLVCCALGYGRSAAAAAAWMIVSGRSRPDAAIAEVTAARPGVVLGPLLRERLMQLQHETRS